MFRYPHQLTVECLVSGREVKDLTGLSETCTKVTLGHTLLNNVLKSLFQTETWRMGNVWSTGKYPLSAATYWTNVALT